MASSPSDKSTTSNPSTPVTPGDETTMETNSPLLSPQSMANAALANAVFAQQAQRTVKLAFTQEKDIPVNENGETERRKQFSDDNKDEERNNCSHQQLDKNNAVESIVKDPKSRIEAIWGSSNSDHTNAWKTTAELIRSEIEALLKLGTEAYQAAEFQARESKLLQDELDGKDDELERLRLAESKGRATIVAVKNLQCSPLTMRRYTLAFIPFRQNLLRQGETSKVDARDTSRAAVSEAGLRAELGVVTAQKNESLGQAEGHKRKATLYEDELRQVKTKLARVVQEKIRIERDHRATLSLAKSFDSHVSSDVDYYKRKVSELNGYVQNLNAVVAEKNRQIEDLRRQIERSMSQNRLAQFRADTPDALTK